MAIRILVLNLYRNVVGWGLLNLKNETPYRQYGDKSPVENGYKIYTVNALHTND